jgi:CheY-like chemotaxis protein
MTNEKPQRALVVDDDVAIRLMLARVLEREHFSVETAKDGVEALDRLTKEHFDVVFLDLMMPRIDGIGVIKYLRSHDPSAVRTIIVMTAFSNVSAEIFEGEPVGRVMEKPFDIAQMIESAMAISSLTATDAPSSVHPSE